MIFEEQPEYRPAPWTRVVVGVAATLAVVLAIVLVARLASSDSDGSVDSAITTASTVAVDTLAPPATLGDARVRAVDGTVTTSDLAATSDPPTATNPSSTNRAAPATSGADEPRATSTSVEPTDTFGYPASADGTPLPIVAVFDTDTISLTGQIPSQAAKDRLAGLATANSQFPDAVVVDNLVVNPAVPITVGVRVIELNSVRFPEGSADILPEHAAQLDRVVGIMTALPNVSVVVVGHADQRGDDLANFAISDERARAVVNYLLYLGVEPARLASRAAGESDLLALGDDDVSLALNRRTEFIFSGLLIE